MDEDIFASVRRGFDTVARMARHVRIREDLIPAYAAALPAMSPANVLDETHHYSGDAESTAAYILTLDSLNFGSGYQPRLLAEGWDLIDNSLYFTISTRLKRRFEEQGPLAAARLADIGAQECAQLLGLDPQGEYSMEFAGQCTGALRELGAAVGGGYAGRYLDLVKDAQGSAETMVRLLVRLHNFNDVHSYRGHTIPFYKRAQITAADLHLAFARLGTELFADIGRLTMFPDNAVPHVFHADGLLEYEPGLAARIAKGDEIPSGAEEEVEIRACAGYIVERISLHKSMIPMAIDHILWHQSVENPRYRQTPAHMTLSRFY